MDTDSATVIARTRRWVQHFVIGLNLCPFARRVFDSDRIRYFVSEVATEDSLLVDLTHELQAIVSAPRSAIETTLLIHPRALLDFLDYNDFLTTADVLLRELGLRGTIQIASFHPQYRFARTSPHAVENSTNRSPYPMLHLLREVGITEVSSDEAFLQSIPTRNIETLRRLGRAGIEALLRDENHPPHTASR